MAPSPSHEGLPLEDREHLDTGVGDGDRMLELGRELAVDGDGGPAVLQCAGLEATGVDHGLDGKDHALFKSVAATAVVVGDLRRRVERATETVANEILDDTETVFVCMGLDGFADVAHAAAILDGLDAQAQALLGDLDELFHVGLGSADEEGLGGVAEPAVDDGADVDVDDVALLQLQRFGGDAVAHDLVHRGADAARVPVVVEGPVGVAPLRRPGDGDVVEFLGADPWLHEGADMVKHLGRDAAGATHAIELGRRQQHNSLRGLHNHREAIRWGWGLGNVACVLRSPAIGRHPIGHDRARRPVSS